MPSQASSKITGSEPIRPSSYEDKTHEEKKTDSMTTRHDLAATLFNKTRSKVKLDTLDKLTREMRRRRNLAHKTDTAIANGKSKFHMARIIVDIDLATAAARRAYVIFRYQLDTRKSEPDHSDKTN